MKRKIEYVHFYTRAQHGAMISVESDIFSILYKLNTAQWSNKPNGDFPVPIRWSDAVFSFPVPHSQLHTCS